MHSILEIACHLGSTFDVGMRKGKVLKLNAHARYAGHRHAALSQPAARGILNIRMMPFTLDVR